MKKHEHYRLFLIKLMGMLRRESDVGTVKYIEDFLNDRQKQGDTVVHGDPPVDEKFYYGNKPNKVIDT